MVDYFNEFKSKHKKNIKGNKRTLRRLRNLEPVEKAMRDAKMDKRSINDFVLIGGSGAYKSKDRLDAKLVRDGINFMYIRV